jgi:uncharacterized protein
VHRLTRDDARRVAVRAQLLTADRPTDPLEVVRHLTFVQYDATSAVAPSPDLVLWSRLGPSYDAGWWRRALDEQELVDHHGLMRPVEDLALYRAEMAAWPGVDPKPWELQVADWVEANDGCRRDLLALLRTDGPLPATAMPDTCEVPWKSSGWNNDKNVQRLLVQMVERGEVSTAGRTDDGREKLWDLAERVYTDDPVPDLDEAFRQRDEKRLAMLGIARAKAAQTPSDPNHVGGAGEEAVVEGVRGRWRVDPAYLDGDLDGRTALLSPLDRLVFDRKRMAELFEFDYALEMYKPAAERRWGYFALPVLHGDRLVGKVDATAERAEGVLRVDAVHEDFQWSRETRTQVHEEIEALAAWLGLEVYRP